MNKKIVIISVVLFLVFVVIFFPVNFKNHAASTSVEFDTIPWYFVKQSKIKQEPPDSIKIVVGTFLGNFQNNYYGDLAPSKLDLKWKKHLGCGKTVGGIVWYGAGWTGQPLVVLENDKKYLIQGAYDHNLKKIDALTGNIIWQYEFDDVLKGTGTMWINTKSNIAEERYVILQGSRRGANKSISADIVASYRAISYVTGRELWRLNSKQTDCYSRDVDASALILHDTAYIGLENGYFTVFNPAFGAADSLDGLLQPNKYQEIKLYTDKDVLAHGKNLVIEASACLLGHRIYVPSATGYLYGYNLKTKVVDWEFYVGSDLNGSPVVTNDNCLLLAVEKQYIKGRGGMFKLDPSLPPDSAVVWFFPTKNKQYAEWFGGVIGSVSINDSYKTDSVPSLAAFTGIDGNLYVVNHKEISSRMEKGPDDKTLYPTPKLVYKQHIGAGISTPVFVGNRIVAAGYGGIYLYEHDAQMEFSLLDYKPGVFEATPVADNGRVYVASRDGYLYCFGGPEEIKKVDDIEEPLLVELVKEDTVEAEDKTELIAEIVKTSEPDETIVDILEMEQVVEEQPVDNHELAMRLKSAVGSAINSVIDMKLELEKRIIEKQKQEELAEAALVKEENATGKVDKSKKYQIIAGSYKTLDRTTVWDKELHEKGFETVILGPIKGNYYNSVSSHDSYGEAIQEVLKIREGGTEQVWVMEYKPVLADNGG